MGWWPFGGGTDDQAGAMLGCPSCGKEVDETWENCAYCGHDFVAQAGGEASLKAVERDGDAVLAASVPNRTVAIYGLPDFTERDRKVVGWLLVLSGSNEGMDFRLFSGRNTIGAGVDNDVVLTDAGLIDRHATIRYEDGNYFLIDQGSSGGSYVNDRKRKISKYELIDGDVIWLDQTKILVKCAC